MKKFKFLFLCLILLFLISCTKNSEKITIVLDWVPNTNHTGLFVAKELGYFKEYNLNVEIVQPPEGSTTQLIGSGNAEFGISFQDTLAKYFDKDHTLPVTAIAAIIQHNTSGILSLKKSNILRPRDLENTKYGTWEDNIEQAIVKKIVTDDGGNYSTLSLIPFSGDIYNDLGKNVDSAWIFYAWDGVASEINGLETNFINIGKLSDELDYYTPVIIGNNKFIKEHKTETKNLLKAIKKGYEYAISNPEKAADILVKNAPELDKKLVLASQKWINKEYINDAKNWGEFDSNRWNKFYNWLYENKLIENKIDKDFGFSNEYLELK